MKRVNVKDAGDWVGWFNMDAAEEIASYKAGDPYVDGKILYATKKGKLIVNEWNNYSPQDTYRYASNEAEIAEMLSRNCADGAYEERLVKILDKYEL